MKSARFDFIRPAGLPQAAAALAAAGAKPLSGGQSLGPMLNLRLARPTLLVDVARLAGLRAVEETSDGAFFGAAITHAEIEDGAVPDPTGGVMAAIARGIAYRAVRNRGTIGGSLAHADPSADWPTTLAALGARVEMARGDCVRTLPLEEFMIGAFETALEAGEIVMRVFVPRLSAGARWGYAKHCRKVGEFAEAMCAVLIDTERGVCRLAVGATQSRPIVFTRANAEVDRPENIDPTLLRAGLADVPATFNLHRVVIRQAIAIARAQTGAAP